ncbi:MAG: glycosyltransferase family 1 protein [Deferrisomatales bacterium]
MKIALTLEHVDGRKTGVGRCAFELARALARQAPEHEVVVLSPMALDPADRRALEAAGRVRVADRSPRWQEGLPPEVRVPLWTELTLRRRLRAERPEAFLHTGAVWPLVPFRGPGRRLAFVHDLIPLLYPDYFRRRSHWHFRLTRRTNLGAFHGFVVNSEATGRDLQRAYGVDRRAVTVAPLGRDERFAPVADPELRARVRARYGLPGAYLLAAGTLEPRKNLDGLVEAYARCAAARELPLVIVGKKGWMYERVFAAVARHGLDDRVLFPGYVADEDLPAVYAQARVFVYPSFYEGFGLPVLEAMACGVPVVTSTTSSLPEVAGDGALLVDPRDVGGLARALDALVGDPARAARLARAGRERAARFTWAETARRTLAALGLPPSGEEATEARR